MDQLQQFTRAARRYAYLMVASGNALLIVAFWAVIEYGHFSPTFTLWILVPLALLVPFVTIKLISSYFSQPIEYLWQAILYVAPERTDVAAPDLSRLRHGRELITNLVSQVYRLADVSQSVTQSAAQNAESLDKNFVANSLPLPLVVLDKEEAIVFANKALLDYVGRAREDTVHQSVYSVLDMAFSTDQTFDVWLAASKQNTVNASQTWERVRLSLPEENKSKTLLFDLAAYYNKDNTSGWETMLVLFDHTKQYSSEDNALNFVELAVHELRGPLTMLRGYIEVFQEELTGKVSIEIEDYLQKIQVASLQLTTFVNNILNVARVEDDQMLLKLHEENWDTLLKQIINELSLRAKVRGIKLKVGIATDIPSVGCDPTSIYEVLSNLVDNAIKYSGTGNEIHITSVLTKNGLVETAVKDFGVGIPASAVPKVFDKFYRDHHNRAQVGGTGIGLYLTKMIVEAHGGNVWVKSKEGQGTTIGFTLLPYSKLAEAQKTSDNGEITRSVHGWIKNHSLYRR